MELFLVRHADALDAGPGMPDEERPLSENGQEKMRKAARGLRSFLTGDLAPLDAVLSSPRRRALETARILAQELNGSEEVEVCEPLGRPFTWHDLLPHLASRPPEGRVALVGHEPDLGRLAGWLLGRQHASPVPLKKGSIIAFAVSEPLKAPRAELLWFLTSKQLRLMRS